MGKYYPSYTELQKCPSSYIVKDAGKLGIDHLPGQLSGGTNRSILFSSPEKNLVPSASFPLLLNF
jgi:hypothetical protein